MIFNSLSGKILASALGGYYATFQCTSNASIKSVRRNISILNKKTMMSNEKILNKFMQLFLHFENVFKIQYVPYAFKCPQIIVQYVNICHAFLMPWRRRVTKSDNCKMNYHIIKQRKAKYNKTVCIFYRQYCNVDALHSVGVPSDSDVTVSIMTSQIAGDSTVCLPVLY